MARLDHALFHWLNGVAVNPWLDAFMRVVTSGRFWAPVLVAGCALLLWRGGRRGRVAVLAALVALALADAVAAQILKPLVGRLRPCQAAEAVRLLVSCGGRYGFPSNHAANGAAMAVALAFFYPRSLRYSLPLVLLVAWSRVYVGVHYPGDVLFGACLGGLAGLGCGWLARARLLAAPRREGPRGQEPPGLAGGGAAGEGGAGIPPGEPAPGAGNSPTCASTLPNRQACASFSEKGEDRYLGRALPPAGIGSMTQRVRAGLITGLLLAATMVRVAPVRPAMASLPTGSPSLVVGLPSFDPPEQLRLRMNERLAAGDQVGLNMVVVLVDFVDQPADRVHHPAAHFDSMLFLRGASPGGSMTDYYDENSGGRFRLEGVVLGWYRMPRPYAEYVGKAAGLGAYPGNSQGLAEDAVRAADPQVNFAAHDSDGPDGVPDTMDDDGNIDLLMVIHAGPQAGSFGDMQNLLSVAWWMKDPVRLDGVNAAHFAMCPEIGGMGIHAHETGHLLGLPDLYDYTGKSFGLGAWSLMSGPDVAGGASPPHLDPWCKQLLGWVAPVNITGTLDDAVLDPVETGGTVYRLSPNGSVGTEYFLVENRRRIGFDGGLPGEGLLIYHVDESRSSNNDRTRYLVGLEQADGLYQLEAFAGSGSFGDDGDPYTEATASGGFGRFTVPDSRSHSGAGTGVTVYRIRGPDASGRILASFRSVSGPSVRLDSLDVVPVSGNGDRFIEPGEVFDVRPSLTVQAGPAHDVRLDLTSGDPLAVLETSTLPLGSLATGGYPEAGSLRVRVGENAPSDPYGLSLTLRVSYREEIAIQRFRTVPIGTSEGLWADFEEEYGEFTHRPNRPGFRDYWRRTASEGTGGGGAWYHGQKSGDVSTETDAVLMTPFFIIPPDGVLEFDQRVEIPPGESGEVAGGAFVEISVNGGGWTQIAPTRGYDRTCISEDPDLNGRSVFTGDAPGPPVWEKVRFRLGQYSGGAVARFRYFSTGMLLMGKGWWIDNVQVRAGATPALLEGFSATRMPDGVLLEWTLAGEARLVGLRVERAPDGTAAFEALAGGLLPVTMRGTLTDAGADPAAGYVYRLSGVGRDGEIHELGRIQVPPGAFAPPRARLAAFPNPARAGSMLELTLARESPVRADLCDAAGRKVRSLLAGALPPGTHQVYWNGTDDGGMPLPAGIYFCRFLVDGTVLTRKLVLTR